MKRYLIILASIFFIFPVHESNFNKKPNYNFVMYF